MNPETILQNIQKGFRVGIGATTTLVEGMQNPTLYQQNLDRLRTNPLGLVEELAEKGAVTEQEARANVDRLWANRNGQPASEMVVTTSAVPVGPDVQTELKSLTEQLIALRQEIAALREQQQGT
jgi:polyhydroxyalkanoate synthesis regulator phasin